ncbi:MAG TPA: type II toxin-antitoxin system antitoxin, RelB/DinJ family [Treponema sp.]|nr:type II toxin-antitoxin system antitoxin, RelB/DinJ family [Treponema sp.]
MPTKTRLNVNIDSALKEETSKMLEKLGMDFTTAITVYFNQIVRKRKIPFEISDVRYYSVEEVAGSQWRDGLEKVVDEWE